MTQFLTQELFKPLLIKGYLLHYCQNLIKTLKKNEHLVEKPLHSKALPGDEELAYHNLQPGDCLLEKPFKGLLAAQVEGT